MTLEELIEKRTELWKTALVVDAKDVYGISEQIDALDIQIIDFVMDHADELIAWERTNHVRTSPFDEDGVS